MDCVLIRKILLAAFTLFTAAANCTPQPTILIIKKFDTNVNNKPTQLFKIEQPNGAWGFRGVKGQMFDAIVKNQTDKPTVIHWHGLLVPNDQDGVPYVTQKPIPPGGEYHYHFPLKQSGTYWMHSHGDLETQRFLSAPFILIDKEEKPSDQDITLFIGDFSFKTPDVIFAGLKSNMSTMHHDHGMSSMPMKMDSKSDLVDVTYDAFLTNYRTLNDPDVMRVKPRQEIRLRFIVGSAMSNFIVHTGKLQAKAIAIDGQPMMPVQGNTFQVAIGQRLDVLVKIPEGENAYPILAQGEGTKMQTGMILATPKAAIPKLKEQLGATAGALNYDQEFQFKAAHPLKVQKPGQTLMVSLEGNMMNYIWTINNKAWPKIKPLQLSPNKRIEMVFDNKTSMAHPMHLHGHIFEVAEIDNQPIKDGLMHDTVLVLPHSIVKVQFDSNNPGYWMMHCHMLYHQESGMMTIVNYDGVPAPKRFN